MRSSFVIPYFLINYSLSVTDSKTNPYNSIVSLKYYIIGNNGFLIPSTIYIYLGGTAERLVSLLKSNDPEMQKYELFFILTGGIILTVLICFVSYVTKKKLD